MAYQLKPEQREQVISRHRSLWETMKTEFLRHPNDYIFRPDNRQTRLKLEALKVNALKILGRTSRTALNTCAFCAQDFQACEELNIDATQHWCEHCIVNWEQLSGSESVSLLGRCYCEGLQESPYRKLAEYQFTGKDDAAIVAGFMDEIINLPILNDYVKREKATKEEIQQYDVQ